MSTQKLRYRDPIVFNAREKHTGVCSETGAGHTPPCLHPVPASQTPLDVRAAAHALHKWSGRPCCSTHHLLLRNPDPHQIHTRFLN